MLCRFIRNFILQTALSAALSAQPAAAEGCREALVTSYSVEDYPGPTASGVLTGPNVGSIVAGGGAYELGSTVWVEGLGSSVVADRGNLGHHQVDLLVSTHAEAVVFGRQVRVVCG